MSYVSLSGQQNTRFHWTYYLLIASALSIGWGIRGNFGHEWGAAMPGALSALVVVVASGRKDWYRKVAYFGAFGAVGWAFGGAISYMQVIGFTHSGDSLSQWYGFVCLFVIGFLWGGMGGGFSSLPAYLNRKTLKEFISPAISIFIVWWIWGVIDAHLLTTNADYRQNSPLYWFDTDWLDMLLAICVCLVDAVVQQRFTKATSLLLHMSAGWWISFLLLPVTLHIRMTPPRGDSWAGCLGATIGMLVFFHRQKLFGPLYAALASGFIGGIGFSGAALLKMLGMKSGLAANWHSFLEQSYGWINGVGMAVAFALLIRHAPLPEPDDVDDKPTFNFMTAFLLLGLTYMNMIHLPQEWIKHKVIPEQMYFLSTNGWFDLGYILLAACMLWLLWLNSKKPLALIPTDWLGRSQMLFLALLWWIVIGNFLNQIDAFSPERLLTEGFIHFHALFCTGLAIVAPFHALVWQHGTGVDIKSVVRRAWILGLLAILLVPVAEWGITRAVYGDTIVGGGKAHIRFGPNATAVERKPKKNEAHP